MSDLGLTATWGRQDWSPVLIEALTHESAVARGGVRLIPVRGRTGHIPRVLINPEADWVAELAELPSDAGDADTIELIPKKIGNVIALSSESIEDAEVNELDAVGRSMVRGVATKVDAKFFSDDAATATAPAGLLAATLPGTESDIDIPALVTGVGAISAEGGLADVIWISPADLTALRLEALTGAYATLADPQAPGIERVAGARLVQTPALAAGTAVIADTRYVVAGVRRDAEVDFSGHAAFTRDAVAARVTMRVDWDVADANGVYVIEPVTP